MVLASVLFIGMYILLLTKPDYRWITALVTAALFVALQILPVGKVLPAINWNILLMLTGTMLVVQLFIDSNMPMRLAELLLQVVPNVCWAVVALSLFSGFISAFVDNVATVLMLAPIGLAVSKKLNCNPIPIIISISVSSNLQGAATLVGDTTSILLGEYAGMSFNDFFWFLGRPGIFFAVELGALMTVPVLLFLFRKERGKVEQSVDAVVTDYVPTMLLVGVVVSLIIASQFEKKPALTNGFLCMTFAVIGTIYEAIRQKGKFDFKSLLSSVDYQTLLLLAGLFVVIEGITEAGIISAIADVFVKFGGDSPFVMYTIIVFASVVISAFVDNIPYVATMLPVVQGIAASMGIEPYLLYYGLLIGATLGGNLTPVGASANIAGIGILEKNGHKVSTMDFLKIGIPFTMVAVLCGYAFIWIFWH